MSVRLEVTAEVAAPIERVWEVLVDWPGQERWIPLTTVRVTTEHDQGLGVRADALSGFWLGPVPLGLLDRFIVTGWSPPAAGLAELEVLHLGPYFTGPGVFRLDAGDGRTVVTATELFDLPGGRVPEALVRLALPVMRVRVRAQSPSSRRPGRARVTEHRDRARVTEPGVLPGPDGALRCSWALSAPEYLAYHDHEWGRPVTTAQGLYERMTLEAFQSGLAWITILRKRDSLPVRLRRLRPGPCRGLRRGRRVAAAWRTRESCATGPRSRRRSATRGWSATWGRCSWTSSDGSPCPLARGRDPARCRPPPPNRSRSPRSSNDTGIRFFGPTTAYALMQAVGLVDDHLDGCFVPPPTRP